MSYFGIAWAWVKGVFSTSSSAKEAVLDYVLGKLNDVFGCPDCGPAEVSETKIGKVFSCADTAYYYMAKFSDWCPKSWLDEYNTITEVVKTIRDATEDGKVTSEEFMSLYNLFKFAYSKWMED